MTRGNYRASGKRAKWDWTPKMDRDLKAVRIQPHTERYRGFPSCFLKVAEKYGRTIKVCIPDTTSCVLSADSGRKRGCGLRLKTI